MRRIFSAAFFILDYRAARWCCGYFRAFATAGGLMSYGTDLRKLWRLVGIYTGRVLNGENPGDLPVQQTTKVELIVNLKAATALGLTVCFHCSAAPTR
jgi:ABC-type uncharacterized transport system substrate-binding protein